MRTEAVVDADECQRVHGGTQGPGGPAPSPPPVSGGDGGGGVETLPQTRKLRRISATPPQASQRGGGYVWPVVWFLMARIYRLQPSHNSVT